MKNSNSQNTTDSRLLKILTIACFATAAFFGLRALAPQSHGMLASATAESSPKVELTKPHSSLETQNIEDIRLGQRVVGTNPLREQTLPASSIDPATWRAVRLNMMQAGVPYDLAFLRPLSWIESTGAQVGGSIHMKLEEMGLDGPAQVVGIDACPAIELDDGTGRNVVTGTMAHPGDNILYLDITGLDEPLGVTDTHPIWSETRQDFVVAGQLEVGEQFRTLTGESATLTKIHPHRGPPQMVFNLEVDAEHVYAVAGSGLLVHNACPNALPPGASADEAGRRGGEIRQWLNDLPEMKVARDRLEDLGVSSRGFLNPPQSIPNALREAGEHGMADNLIEAGSVGFQRLADILFRRW